MTRTSIDIVDAIDSGKLGRYQIGLLVLLGLSLVMDGFDVQAMGYVAPALTREWHIPKGQLGPVFGAGLFGMLAGSLVLSTLADLLGRRRIIVAATLLFAACMFATAFATSVSALQWLRFVGGFGMGAIMPNAMALAEEFSPRRSKTTLMMFVSCGYTVGGVIGGLASAVLIPAFGWRSVFVVGGIIPGVIVVLMFVLLPESMQFLLRRGAQHERVRATLQRMRPDLVLAAGTEFAAPMRVEHTAPVRQLFAERRAPFTLLMWIVNFMNLLNLYFLASWLPSLAKDTGMSLEGAVLVGTMFQVGGIVGTLFLGPLIDRVGYYKVLGTSFAVAALSIFVIGHSAGSPSVLFLSVAISGFCVVGGQAAVNILAAAFYPAALRSTGVGWSLGVGRIGSIVGPVVGGLLISMQWGNRDLFTAVAVPAIVSALTIALMSRYTRRSGQAIEPAAGSAGNLEGSEVVRTH